MPDAGTPELKPEMPADAGRFICVSAVLQQLQDEAPTDHFTLDWLLGRLNRHSFGVIILLLAVIAMAPGICVVAGLLLMVPAIQMIAGHSAPVFPRRIATRPLPTRHLARLIRRAVPVLRYVEKIAHPRWPTPHQATKRFVGVIVVIQNTTLLFAPIPLFNIIPALMIILISLAYLEEDGVLLSIALLVAVIVLMGAATAVWETIAGAKWIVGLS